MEILPNRRRSPPAELILSRDRVRTQDAELVGNDLSATLFRFGTGEYFAPESPPLDTSFYASIRRMKYMPTLTDIVQTHYIGA